MNPHVSSMYCQHAEHHLEVQVSNIPLKTLEMANKALSDRIKEKITNENLFSASHGFWSETTPPIETQGRFISGGVGYRLMYYYNKHHYCVHVGDKNHPHTIEIHGDHIGIHLPSDPKPLNQKHRRHRVICQIL